MNPKSEEESTENEFSELDNRLKPVRRRNNEYLDSGTEKEESKKDIKRPQSKSASRNMPIPVKSSKFLYF